MAILNLTEGQSPTVGATFKGLRQERVFENVGMSISNTGSALNRRVTVVEPTGGPYVSVTVTTPPAVGRATVRADNKITLDLTNYEGETTQSIVVETDDGTTVESQTIDIEVVDSRQDNGWGRGKYPLLETDIDNRIIAEPGRNHRTVHVSPTGFTKAQIESREGISNASANVLKALVSTVDPDIGELYGSTPDLALDEDRGKQLWNAIDNDGDDGYTSNWLLFKRGGTYGDTFGYATINGGRGESILHPMLIGSYGDDADPAPHLSTGVKLWPSNASCVVIQDLDIVDMRLRGNDFVTLDNVSSEGSLDFQNNNGWLTEGTILRRSRALNVVKPASYAAGIIANGGTVWPEHGSRESAQFISSFKNFLVEDVWFHHGGWVDGYDVDIDINFPQPPSQYSHDFYTSAGGTQDEDIDGEISNADDMTLRRSFVSEGALTGFQGRTGVTVYNTAFLGNNVAITLGGGPKDTILDRRAGNFSIGYDMLVTWAGQRETNPWTMATAQGIRQGCKNCVTHNNIVIHAGAGNDGIRAHGIATKGVAIGLNDEISTELYDDTLIYDWVDSIDANLGTLSTATLDALTIENYTDTADVTTGSTRYDFIDRLLTDDAPWEQELTDVMEYFQTGCSMLPPTRSTARTSVFQPHDTIPTPGMRGDIRLDWDDEIVPGHVAGDSIDLNGHILNWFDNPKKRLANLSVNGGEWHQWGGKVDLSGNITTGGAMRVDGAAQLFCGDMNVATDVLDIGIRSGRIANTGTWQGNFDLEVSLDAEALLGIDTGTCTIDSGRTLTIIGERCFVGFDGGSGGASTLAFNAGATLSFKPMMRLPFVGGDTDVFVNGSTVTGGTSGFTGTIERIVWGTSTGTGWLWINTFSGVPTTGEDLVAIGTYKAQPIASGMRAQAGIPEFTIGKIAEFRSGMFGNNDPDVVSAVTLTNAALEVDISGLTQGDYDLIDVDTLTGTLSSQSLNGASLAQVGNRLVLTVS